jgi:2-methylcitrate dehydratase PrpD
MRKIIVILCLVGFAAFLTKETKAQQPVSQSERRTVIKALETKIAEIEVKRAMDAPYYTPTATQIVVIDAQLANLRKRLSELLGKRRSVATKRNPNNNALAQNRRRSKAQN